MPEVLVSPGQAFNEIDKSFFVPALSPTQVGMVGTATKGVLDTLTVVTSQADFTSKFGKQSSSHLATFAALQYLSRGRLLTFVRVAASAVSASAILTSDASAGVIDGTNAQNFTITASSAASIVGSEVGPFVIGAGVDDGVSLDIDNAGAASFTLTAGTITTQVAVDDINAGTTGATASVGTGADAGKIVVTSNTTGATSEIEVAAVANDAYAVLGEVGAGSFLIGTNNGSDGTDLVRVSVDGGGDQDITLTAGTRTAAQVAAEITALAGATSTANGDGTVRIVSVATGVAGTIQVQAASTADTPLGFDNALHAGLASGGTSVTVTAGTLGVANPGTWANAASGVGGLSVVSAAGSTASTFKLTVSLNNVEQEVWDNLSKTPGTTFHETVINDTVTGSAFITTANNGANPGDPTAQSDDLISGDDGEGAITATEYVGSIAGLVKTGMQLFRSPEDVTINILSVPGVDLSPVVAEVITISEARGDCLGVIDPPSGLTRDQVISYHNGALGGYTHSSFNSSFAALYWPWVTVFDSVGNVNLLTPPSGHAIAAMARTDFEEAEWYAAAGNPRGVISTGLSIEYNSSQADRDLLYDQAGAGNVVNPIIDHPAYGITIWGNRTLSRTASALDRINVRRLTLKIRQIVKLAGDNVLFEPADLVTARRFKNAIEPQLEDIKQRRGLDDYAIVTDETVNTSEVLGRNEVRAEIHIIPVKTAEFFIVNLTINEAGATLG